MGNRIREKVAIITGGAGGIGSAVGKLFCEEGGRVVLVDRDAAALDAALEAILHEVPQAEIIAVVADVSQEAEAHRIVSETISKFGCISVLVNIAGIREYWRLADAPAESWQNILSINLLSYAYMAKAAIPAMRETGNGSIINVSSTYGVNGRAGMGQYDATKAAILALSRTLAFEEVGHGIRANTVCPGFTVTPFHVRQAEAKGRSEASLRGEKIEACLMHRWGDPREVAYPILWLASDEASYITATALMVDGGRPVI